MSTSDSVKHVASSSSHIEEEEKPHLTVRVVAQNGSEMYFKLKTNTPLQRLMTAYCQNSSISPKSVRFLFDGNRIEGSKTPAELGIESDDVIDVVLQQTGGGL